MLALKERDGSMVTAIVVSYQPEFATLTRLLAAVIPQVGRVVVVDNGSSVEIDSWLQAHFPGVDCLELGRNYGIAHAQNRGIAWAARQGAVNSVLLLDQDSEPEEGMVAALLFAKQRLLDKGVPVACVGPRYTDERQQNPPPFLRLRGLRMERCPCVTSDSVPEVEYLIASGCLIPLQVLELVDGMREDLFIDYVDIEWGLRAKSFGYRSFGVCSARMKHSLGSDPIRFFGRYIPMHSPLRHYYHFRNAVLLYREAWVPFNWKLVDGWRLLLKYGFYTIFGKPRLEHWRMMTLGLRHGLQGKTGKFEKG